MQRTLGRFWFQNAELEKAATIYSSILDRLPSLPSYSPTDEADLQLELGQLFLQSNRIEQAKTALAQAQALYEQAGEEFELLALQAEALLADLD